MIYKALFFKYINFLGPDGHRLKDGFESKFGAAERQKTLTSYLSSNC